MEEDYEQGWHGPDDWGPRQYRLDMAAAAVLAGSIRAEGRRRLTGRGRHNTLVVLDVLCDLLVEHEISRVFCSQRDLCEKAGLGSRSTVRRALAELEEAGMVKFAGTTGPGFGRCFLWDLSRPTGDTGMTFGLSGKHLDIWRNPPTGIGHNAHLVHDALTDGASDIASLVDATGISRATVYRVLRRLAERDLAVEGPSGWVPGRTLPHEYGTARLQKAHRLHEKQRAAFHRDLPEADLSQR